MVTIKNKKFLVLGGAGFIGSHCSDALLKNGASQVVVMDNLFLGKKENLSDSMSKFKNKIYLYEQDATSYKDLKIIVENHKPDIILNFATKALLYSFEDPSDAYKVNVDIALNTLELLRHNAFERFIHISTSEVFGSALTVPMSEEHPRKPETTYAAGKAAADLAIFSYVNMFKLNALILRPFNNYGPRQNCNALAALIPQTIKRIYEGLPPIVEGDGQQTRDFIYVEDTINQVLQFLDKPQTNNLDYNIGSGKETSIIEIVKSICEIMGYSKDIEFRPERIADVKRHCADIALTESFLGKITLTPLSVGIEKTINWYLEKVKNDTIIQTRNCI